jgi:hypothetical protein
MAPGSCAFVSLRGQHRRMWRAILLAVPALWGCRDWRAHVDPARAAEDPEQLPVEDPAPIVEELKGYRVVLTPRAAYRITGYAVELARDSDSRWDFTMPMALGLAWGAAADPAVLHRMKFRLTDSLGGLSWSYELPPGAPAMPDLNAHISNNHLIAASPEVKHALERIRVGDLVTLAGELVDLEVHQGEGPKLMYENTSLSRTDQGDGACEVIWVEQAESERL